MSEHKQEASTPRRRLARTFGEQCLSWREVGGRMRIRCQLRQGHKGKHYGPDDYEWTRLGLAGRKP